MSYIYDLTDTWNAGATTFTAIKMNVTDTASASGSLLMDLQVGGSSKFSVTKAGSVSASAGYFDPTGVYGLIPNVGGLFLDVASLFVVRNAASGYGDFFRASSVGISIGPSADTILTRDAANTLAQRNGTNAQAFRIYSSFTDTSNYERLTIGMTGSTFDIVTQNAGTGVARQLRFGNANTIRWVINDSGHFLAGTDNTYDIGASGATRPRNLFLGGYILIGSGQSYGWSTRSGISSPSDGVVGLYNNAANDFGRLQFGGTTSSFPSLKRSSATLQARLADDSAFAAVAGLVDLTATQAADSIGTRGVPQNSQSAAYTLVIEDAGKHILHPSADTTARTFTIPANGTVAFAVGTVVTFVNQNAGGVITIAITTDTMRLAGAGTTGSRTLAANGIATAIKVTSTEWLISGTGLT
jgi:hypothetical protein